ncbi:MAG TPA: hypothetical protein VEP90_15150, partial [Methylomirabilota bacterium]|nr:hypothetical protein [Methylomirabilota bacterium]
MELQNPDLTPENCPRTWEGRSLTAHGGLVLNHIPVFDQNPVLDANDVGCNPVHTCVLRSPKSPWKPYGNPIGTNSYDTHIIMRTNCIV